MQSSHTKSFEVPKLGFWEYFKLLIHDCNRDDSSNLLANSVISACFTFETKKSTKNLSFGLIQVSDDCEQAL